ncbi:MAG: sensor histidine kinase [Saprospiraceae bacterium]|nr:sensor histidine kinase [Saprospiraceae bacterium]MCF8249262.1 sensor histidine kinase [Saprospiraceae bacterium]MCF8281170.1 sensor histidine kinase [Bacteroidales bacterium]MCF8311461.1 sensor histidine kinase [Saprospiraceae bacterium]MCF8439881.1 sensor histidine kinase [Saprospiraceae bacterium]
MITSKPSRELGTGTNSEAEITAPTPETASNSSFRTGLSSDFLQLRQPKNPTPNQIVLASSLGVSAFSTIFLALLNLVQHANLSWWMVLLTGTSTFFISFVIFRFYLLRYVQRKIKVIYKSIHKHKLANAEKKGFDNLLSTKLDDVEKEVEEWSASQEKDAEKLKTWQAYRRKFLGDISHELKTPIFNIQGYLETLIEGGLEDENINRNYLVRAAKNVDRLNTIVEDLESISRLESGELILDLQPFDIKVLTEEVFEDLEFRAKERNIRLQLKAGADQGFMIRADREYIRQVLTNLVNNSIKYGKEGGTTKVSFYDMDSNVLIEVADTGIGITGEHLNHLFDRFYRVDKSRSREQGGSGLGLSIVKHIVEAHKQTINVRSTSGVGSTFGFTLEKAL